MASLTENFSLSEFRCRDGSEVPEGYMENVRLLARNLQAVRDRVEVPITVVSGYRSPAYNRKIKGAKKSQHMVAKAADIKIKDMTPRAVHKLVRSMIDSGDLHPGGVGLYKTFVHYDVRGFNARWTGSGIKDDTGVA